MAEDQIKKDEKIVDKETIEKVKQRRRERLARRIKKQNEFSVHYICPL